MLAAVFLEVTGHEFTATEESVVENTLALAAGKLTEKAYVTWLNENAIFAIDRKRANCSEIPPKIPSKSHPHSNV